MKNKNRYLIIALGIVLILVTLQTASAQIEYLNVTDYLSIHVRVSNYTMVDINPANLTWENINPGEESVCATHCAAGNKEAAG